MMAAMNAIVASQAPRPMIRSVFIPPDPVASERGGQRRENGDRLPTAGRLSREIPQAHATRELRGGSSRVLAFDPICAKNSEFVRNRTARSMFEWHGPHREPDAPGAARGLPPTCPRMASPALTGPRPGQSNRIRARITRPRVPNAVRRCREGRGPSTSQHPGVRAQYARGPGGRSLPQSPPGRGQRRCVEWRRRR